MDAPESLQPVCGQEALDLLNCTTESPYDKEKCQRLLEALRQCVINKGQRIGVTTLGPKVTLSEFKPVDLPDTC
ncbi:hypothetical protein KY284_010104 [Solanum tuberosum]|nr:hypothetical protein KY284_010104 [Solanum tuberosum]